MRAVPMIVLHVRAHRPAASHIDQHAKSSWLGKLDARAKLIGVTVFVVSAAILTDTALIAAALLISVAFAGASRIPAIHLARAYGAALPFILIASVSVFLFGGLERGLEMWARTSACVLALLVLATGTETFELFAGLRRLRVPAVISTLLLLTYKHILIMADELSRMKIARKARGYAPGKSIFHMRSLSIVGNTAGMMLVKAADRADRAYEGMKSKGFSKDFRSLKLSRIAAREISFMVAFLCSSATLLAFQLGVLA